MGITEEDIEAANRQEMEQQAEKIETYRRENADLKTENQILKERNRILTQGFKGLVDGMKELVDDEGAIHTA